MNLEISRIKAVSDNEGDLVSENNTKAYLAKIKANFDGCKANNCLDELTKKTGKYYKSYIALCGKAIVEACVFLTENSLRYIGFSSDDNLNTAMAITFKEIEKLISPISDVVKHGDFDGLLSIAQALESEIYKNTEELQIKI
jgi:hypothetical protein